MLTGIKRTIMKYFLIAITVFGCNNFSPNNQVPISNESLDTIKVTPSSTNAAPVLFETAFIHGTSIKSKSATMNLYGITIGKIKIVSGRIVICDPLHSDEYGIPFNQLFPIGEFPVQLSIAKVDNEETIAFARINFSDEPVEKWKLALQEGQEDLPVGGEEMHGYSVDGGVAVVIDDEANKLILKEKPALLDPDLFKEMEKHYHQNWKYSMLNFNKYNMAAFSTGFGDGFFASYIGFDAKGNPCRLLTDLNVVNWKKN